MNEGRYWFKRKTYGWGWTPSAWQGWLITLIFTVLFMIAAYITDATSYSIEQTLLTLFIPNGLTLILLLILICYLTGEPPAWQWGEKKKTRKRG